MTIYKVIASYRAPSKPMTLAAAESLVAALRAQGIHCHIERTQK